MSEAPSVSRESSSPSSGVGPHRDSPVGPLGDRLERKPFAHLIARQIDLVPRGSSLVIALIGPWGAGKSSVLRMAAAHLKPPGSVKGVPVGGTIVVEFNPWLFSGSEQLMQLLFAELGDELQRQLGKRRMKRLAAAFRRYGGALGRLRELPGIGGVFGTAEEVLKGAADAANTVPSTVHEARRALADELDKVDFRIAVLIDDVDRLATEEVRDLMRVVRLVGDFPNVVYLLAFDREPVVDALTAGGINGADYLEKIIQVEHWLPDPAPDRLSAMLEEETNAALGDRRERVNAQRWPEIFRRIIEPLVRTPRHVRRYTNRVPLALDLTGEEVDAADVLALAAVQVFLPDIHAELPRLRRDLVPDLGTLVRWQNDPGKTESKERLEAILDKLSDVERGVVQATYELLFPHTQEVLSNYGHGKDTETEWQAQRRVAHRAAFDTYLTGALPTGSLRIAEIRRIVDSLSEPETLRQALEATPTDNVQEVLRQIYPHLGELAAETVELALPVFASQEARLAPLEDTLRSPTAGLHSFMAALVSRVPAGDARDSMLRRFFDQQPSLSDRLLVWQLARNSDDYGRGFVEPSTLDSMLGVLTDLVLIGPSDRLRDERQLRDLLQVALNNALPERVDEVREILNDDQVLLAFLLNYMVLTIPHDRHVFASEPLVEAFGQDWLQARLERVAVAPPEGTPERDVYALAIKWAADVATQEQSIATDPAESAD